jgi:hypothetical protein
MRVAKLGGDEKWFYIAQVDERFYLLPDEDTPYCSCKHIRVISKRSCLEQLLQNLDKIQKRVSGGTERYTCTHSLFGTLPKETHAIVHAGH